MATKTTKKSRNTNTPRVQELGLFTHYLVSYGDAKFVEPLDVTAAHLESTHATIHRWQKQLIALGWLEIVTKSRRDSRGYQTTPTLRLKLCTLMDLGFEGGVDLAQVFARQHQTQVQKDDTVTKMDLEKPSPNGLLIDNHIPVVTQPVYLSEPIVSVPVVSDLSPRPRLSLPHL
ncbi:MAG TPA: hypothetical protein VJP02_01170 [Candidatus Sulfotelmatobacter sp.]|nr:hypothetical protein [Candidatus Sulfotelmatobacter sp.]